MTWQTMLLTMGEGMLRTCAIFLLTVLFSLPLGIVIMLLRRSRFRVVQGLTKIFIAVMRGTPLMLHCWRGISGRTFCSAGRSAATASRRSSSALR